MEHSLSMPGVKMTPMQYVHDYALITFGLLCYAVGFTCFILPYQITTGAVAGIGALIFYATHGAFPAHYTFLIINSVLLIAAIKELGWRFCVKTIYAVLVLSAFMAVGKDLMQSVQGFPLNTEHLPILLGDNQGFMACVIGSLLEGIGIGLVFLQGGSTGGTDIIAAIVNKYRDVTIGQMMIVLDIIIITSSLFTPVGNLTKLLFGYCTLLITNTTLDYVLNAGRQSVQFLIISRHYESIASAIEYYHRGVTVLDGHGWYSKQEQKVLVVLARRRESKDIFRIIKHTDPNAFVSQSKVIGVYGEGFDKVKVK